jgi:hypothetical protein
LELRDGQQDLFCSRLDQIINMKHELVQLARAIDWSALEARFGVVFRTALACRSRPISAASMRDIGSRIG